MSVVGFLPRAPSRYLADSATRRTATRTYNGRLPRERICREALRRMGGLTVDTARHPSRDLARRRSMARVA